MGAHVRWAVSVLCVLELRREVERWWAVAVAGAVGCQGRNSGLGWELEVPVAVALLLLQPFR